MTFMSFVPQVLNGTPPRPEPARFVNDMAGMFSPSDCQKLEDRLAVYSDTTSTQIVVVTLSDLEGMSAADCATEIGESWGVGSAESDNGVVILVKPKNDNGGGEVFIAVGYGLEGAIPDAYCKRIINEIMIPKFIQEDYYAAVHDACIKIISLADGEDFSTSEEESDGYLFLVIAGIILLIYLLSKFNKKGGNGNPTAGTTGGTTISSGPTTFPSGGFGGGSGSGRSFGGGSFGGGGAGGKW